jgi:predicted MFS family arabinose efflux permease
VKRFKTTGGLGAAGEVGQARLPDARTRSALWRGLSPPLRLQLITVLATGVTTFMFVPLLALHLAGEGMPAGTIGLVAGLLAFSSQALSLVIGMGVDRWGLRTNMAAGFLLRIVGYLLLGAALSAGAGSSVLAVAVVCIGVGGSLLGLSIKTSLVFASPDRPREMLALRSTFVNIGVVAGPAVGGLVYPLGFDYILAACVASHAVLAAAIFARSSPQVPAPTTGERDCSTPDPIAVTGPAARTEQRTTRRQWLVLLLLGVAFWSIYSQLAVILPLAALSKTDSTRAVSFVYTVNGLMCVLLQYALLKRVFHRTPTRLLLLVGFLFFAVADLALALTTGWWAVGLFVVPFTLAELCLAPSLDQQAVSMAPARATGIALGGMGAAGAIGTLLGSWGGGHLLEHFSADVVLIALATLASVVALTSVSLPSPIRDEGST